MSPFAADERFVTSRCTACRYLGTSFRPGHEPPASYYESIVDEGAFESSVRCRMLVRSMTTTRASVRSL